MKLLNNKEFANTNKICVLLIKCAKITKAKIQKSMLRKVYKYDYKIFLTRTENLLPDVFLQEYLNVVS